jgi:hypothetical protein
MLPSQADVFAGIALTCGYRAEFFAGIVCMTSVKTDLSVKGFLDKLPN